MRRDTVISRTRKVVAGLTTPLNRRALRRGVGMAIEHQATLRDLPTMATVIDGGANCGQFALVARRLWPEAAIQAIEPMEDALRTIRDVFDKDSYFTLFDCALGDMAGVATMHVSRASDSSSLLEIGAGQVEEFPQTAAAGTQEVRVVRLDDLLSAADLAAPILLKLDLQGGELDALSGATTLLASVDYVYTEVSFKSLYARQPLAGDICRFLTTAGFDLVALGDVTVGLGRRIIQCDVLYARRQQLA